MGRIGVISLNTYGNYHVRDIQVNTSWEDNPYPGTHAIIPEHLIDDIIKTNGFCDIVLNDDKTELVSFIPKQKPVVKRKEEFSIEKIMTSYLLRNEYRFCLMKQGIDIQNIPENDTSEVRLFDLCKACIDYGNKEEVKSKLNHFLLFGELTNDEYTQLMNLIKE